MHSEPFSDLAPMQNNDLWRDPDDWQLAKKIRTARKDCGLTQEQFAKLLDISRSWVVRIEKDGYDNISPKSLKKIAKVLRMKWRVVLVQRDAEE